MGAERWVMVAAPVLTALLLAAFLLPAPACPVTFSAAALGSALSTLDDPRAQGILERGMRHDGADPLIHLALARLALRDGRQSEADVHLKRAEASLGADLEVRLARVEWMVAAGQGREALARLDEIAAGHPDDLRVPLAKAEALRRLMRFKASLPFYEQYLAHPDPDKHRRDVCKLRYVRLSNALHDFEAKARQLEKRKNEEKR